MPSGVLGNRGQTLMDLCNLYDFYTFVFTLAFTPCTFNVLFYVRIKYYNNNWGKYVQAASVDWCGGDSFGHVRALCDVSKGFGQYIFQMIVSLIINSN